MQDCLADTAASTLPLHLVATSALTRFLAELPHTATKFLQDSGFGAKAGELTLIPGPDGVAGAAFGIGNGGAASPWSYGALPYSLPEGTGWHLAAEHAEPDFDPAAALLGWCLGAYKFTELRGTSGAAQRSPARLLPPEQAGTALIAASAIRRARTLINRPANLLGPAELAAAVGEVAREHGASFETVEGAALREGFPALAAVGAGSPRAPMVAMLRWTAPGAAADAPLIALCGKGVCFDTGGLDLKPSAAMLRMKKDMGGAAIMLGLAEMIMAAQLPLRLLLLVGAVENAISGEAMRPLDVLRSRAGITIEVGNTDAEGRIVLADLIAYAGEQKPDLIVDAATLTGAARVALGPDLPALFSNDDAVASHFVQSARDVHDPLWQLPLHAGYASWLESPVADTNTVSARPMAGSIIAALFLQRFVPPGLRWAHVDVYAWNDNSRPGRPEGGEAQSLRGLFEGIKTLFAQ